MSTSTPDFWDLVSSSVLETTLETTLDALPQATSTAEAVDSGRGSSNAMTLRLVAVMVPIIVIVAVTVWGLLLAGGFMHRRGVHDMEAYADSSPNGQWHAGKAGEKVEEPKLWEVWIDRDAAEGQNGSLRVSISLAIRAVRATVLR